MRCAQPRVAHSIRTSDPAAPRAERSADQRTRTTCASSAGNFESEPASTGRRPSRLVRALPGSAHRSFRSRHSAQGSARRSNHGVRRGTAPPVSRRRSTRCDAGAGMHRCLGGARTRVARADCPRRRNRSGPADVRPYSRMPLRKVRRGDTPRREGVRPRDHDVPRIGVPRRSQRVALRGRSSPMITAAASVAAMVNSMNP